MNELADLCARRARVRQMMLEEELDLLVAVDLARDEITRGHQRWLTGYIPIGGPAAALLGAEGAIELVSERIGQPAAAYYAGHDMAHAAPVELINGFSPGLLAERIARRRPRRVGIAEAETLSFTVAKLVEQRLGAVELVDVAQRMQALRLRKSDLEIELTRRSCAVADAVWQQVPEVFRVGRSIHEIVADIDHRVRLQGAESGFHLVLPLPFRGRAMQSLANPERIEAGRRYLVEISPRWQGYYSQLTIPVSTHADDPVARAAYDDLVAAKQAALPHMRPGVELADIARFVADFLAERGRQLTSLSLGHFCGLALEEPRHDPGQVLTLEAGMTLIFHPVLADAELQSLMRADTYLIGARGAERLNRHAGGMLMLG